MTDYRESVGKSKRRQTGLAMTAGFTGGGGDGGSDDSSSSSTQTFGGITARDPYENRGNDSPGGGNNNNNNNSGGGGGFFSDVKDKVDDVTDTATEVADKSAGNLDERVGQATNKATETVDKTVDDAESAFNEAAKVAEGTMEVPAKFVDRSAGKIDESIARQFDNKKGGGTVDETIEAVDHASGSIDESIARQFDNQKGGGFGDEVIKATDHALGSIDESVHRQFDNQKGGGFADETVKTVTDMTGLMGKAANSLFQKSQKNKDHTIIIGPSSSGGKFSFSVSGTVEGKKAVDGNDTVNESSVSAYIGGGRDYFTFTGKITSIDVPKGTKIVVDGKEVNPQGAKDESKKAGNWSKPSKVKVVGQCVIMKQNGNGGKTRYFTITKNTQGNMVALDSNGNPTALNSVDAFGKLPHFSSVSAAEGACEAAGKAKTGGKPNNDGKGSSKKWSEMKKVGKTGRCVITKQKAEDGSIRYFTLTENSSGQMVAMKADGKAVVVKSVKSLSELPHYPSLSQAESACPDEEENPSLGGKGGRDESTSPGIPPWVPDMGGSTFGVPTNLLAAGGAFGIGALVLGD